MKRSLLALALLSVPALAQTSAPFTVNGRGFTNLQEAVSSIQQGTATILIAPGTYRQCAVQAGGHITFKAVRPGTAIFESVACEGKAAFVLRGLGSAVDGVVFRGYSVPDGNGAGIRIEMGNLTVTNSMFLDSQEGILGGGPTTKRITVDRSTFSGLGQCDVSPGCSHAIYLANDGSVSVTNSRHRRALCEAAQPDRDDHRQQFRRYRRQEDQLHDRLVRWRYRTDRAQRFRTGHAQGEPQRPDRGCRRGEDV
jgi:hypothetical protein